MIRLFYYPLLFGIEVYNYKKNKDILHPLFIMYTMWILLPLAYDVLCLTTQGYHVLSNKFFVVVSFFLICITLFFTLAYKSTGRAYFYIKSKVLQAVDYKLLIAFIIIINTAYIYSICRICNSFNIVYVIQRYRIISLTSPQLISPWVDFFEICSSLIIPMLVYILIYQKRTSRIAVIMMFLLYFIVPVFVASKASLLKRAIILAVCIFAGKRKKRMGAIFLSIILVAGLLFFLIISRDQVKLGGSGSHSLKEYMFSYVFSPFPAFDMLLNGELTAKTMIPGERVFYFWFLLFAKFGFCNRPVDYKDMYLVPVPGGESYTNVFTGMGPYYIDFGIVGIVIYALLCGVLFGYIYKKYKYSDSCFFEMLYVVLLYGLVFQYFGDMIFVYIITTITDVFVVFLVAKIFYRRRGYDDIEENNMVETR